MNTLCVYSGVFVYSSILKVCILQGKVIFIILLVLRVIVNTHCSDLYHSQCAKAPKPHVNLDNGGLGDSGNCCLSAQWKERLSCNGPPVGSICKLLCTAAVWGLAPELHISMLLCLAAWFGWNQFIWRLSLHLLRWVSAFVAYRGSNEVARLPKKKLFSVLIMNSPQSTFSIKGCNFKRCLRNFSKMFFFSINLVYGTL